jgi:hypothetical protein
MRNPLSKVLFVFLAFLVVCGLDISLMATPSDASIANMTAQLGVYSTTDGTYGLEVDKNNTFHFSLTSAGIYYPTSDGTTNQTLTVNQSGQVTAFMGQNNHTQFTLPTAVPGMDYDFVSGVAKTYSIEVQSTDLINYSSETTGTGISNSSGAQGDEIELFCTTANQWNIRNKLGTWAAGN